jgi:hypothetical protein
LISNKGIWSYKVKETKIKKKNGPSGLTPTPLQRRGNWKMKVKIMLLISKEIMLGCGRYYDRICLMRRPSPLERGWG